jgi:hypothetical protein
MVAISADDLAACGEKGTAVGMPFGECSEGYVAASQNCVQDWWKGCPITMFSNGEFTWADGNTHHAVPGMVISAWTGMGANTVTTDQGRALIVVGPTPYYWNGTITQYDIQGGVWTWNWDHSTSVTRPAGLGPETLGP